MDLYKVAELLQQGVDVGLQWSWLFARTLELYQQGPATGHPEDAVGDSPAARGGELGTGHPQLVEHTLTGVCLDTLFEHAPLRRVGTGGRTL